MTSQTATDGANVTDHSSSSDTVAARRQTQKTPTFAGFSTMIRILGRKLLYRVQTTTVRWGDYSVVIRRRQRLLAIISMWQKSLRRSRHAKPVLLSFYGAMTTYRSVALRELRRRCGSRNLWSHSDLFLPSALAATPAGESATRSRAVSPGHRVTDTPNPRLCFARICLVRHRRQCSWLVLVSIAPYKLWWMPCLWRRTTPESALGPPEAAYIPRGPDRRCADRIILASFTSADSNCCRHVIADGNVGPTSLCDDDDDDATKREPE